MKHHALPRRSIAPNNAPAKHTIAIIKHSRLAWTERPLRLMKPNLKRAIRRRQQCRPRGRRRITNFHIYLARLLSDCRIEEAQIPDMTFRLRKLPFRTQHDLPRLRDYFLNVQSLPRGDPQSTAR